jgi:xylulokinase
MDPQARGVIFGLDLSHSRAHIFRAALEAVIYGFRHHVDVLRDAGLEPTRFLATNGGVSSSLWRQIAADVLNEPITSFRNHPGSVLGVAYVAGMAGGLFTGWTEIDRFLTDRYVNTPQVSAAEAYDRGYAIYRELYRRLQTLFPEIA